MQHFNLNDRLIVLSSLHLSLSLSLALSWGRGQARSQSHLSHLLRLTGTVAKTQLDPARGPRGAEKGCGRIDRKSAL